MNHQIAVDTLLHRYEEIFRSKGKSPEWATPKLDRSGLVHPSIPFVGKEYFEQPVKVLMYASAENLNKYNGRLDKDTIAINRHRVYFEDPKQYEGIFPNVHIQPVNNGALVMCAGYIMSKISTLKDSSPAEFLETLSFGNYSKYTVKTDTRNIDCAGNPEKLAESQEYIKADIEVLQPDYIIMIKQMYSGKGKQKDFIDRIKGEAKVIQIAQITPVTLNNPRLFRKNRMPATMEMLNPTLIRWSEKCEKGIIKRENFMYIYPYLDDVLREMEET